MKQGSSTVTIGRGTQQDIKQLRSLWLSLHHHHQSVGRELSPYVDDAQSWKMRKEYYAECLKDPDSFVVLARVARHVVGYAFVHLQPTTTMWSDTWVTGDRTAELVTLVVDPGYRGRGIGTLLFDSVEQELDRIGVRDVFIGALPTNTAALDLYGRRGFRPTWLVLTRFSARKRERSY